MPAVYLTEQEVQSLVTVKDAYDSVRNSFEQMANQKAQNMPRKRLRTHKAMMHVLAGSNEADSQLGWKIYTTTRENARFLCGIYDGFSGKLVCLMEANYLGQLRTGAASAVATEYLANKGPQTITLIGAGLQAKAQVFAIAAVRELKQLFVYSRNQQRREKFAHELSEHFSFPVHAVENPDLAVGKSTLVVTATTSKAPVFSGSALEPGTHINAIGGNSLKRTELDLETFRKTSHVICDSIEQCQSEAGEFMGPVSEGILKWEEIKELQQITTGQSVRESQDEITLFKSVGLGIQDVALGTLVWQRANEQQIGTPLPF